MTYCKKINRECLYYEKCNNNSNSKNIKKSYLDVFKRKNLEKIIFELWIKKIWKLEKTRPEDLDDLIHYYKDKYFYWVYTFNDKEYVMWEKDIEERKSEYKLYTLILAKDNEDYIKLFTSLDNSLNLENRLISTWILLWYPKCCVLEESKRNKDRNYVKNINFVRDNFIFDEGIICKLLNPTIRLYCYRGCSNNCMNTIYICEKVLSYLEWKYWENIVDYFFNEVNKAKEISK